MSNQSKNKAAAVFKLKSPEPPTYANLKWEEINIRVYILPGPFNGNWERMDGCCSVETAP